MKHTSLLIAILLSGFVCLNGSGCKKKQEAGNTPESGMVDVRTAIAKAPKELQDLYYDKVETGIRYGRYPEAVAALDKIASDPSLNEQQKKAVKDEADRIRAKLTNPNP